MTPRTHKAGFTLLELMVVVALIGVMAATIAPNLYQAKAEADVGNVASALVRLGSRARAHTTYTGLAHALAWVPNLGGTEAVVLARGNNSRCNSVVWDFNLAMTNDVDNNNSVLRTARYSTGSQRLRVMPVGGAMSDIQICFQPNGQTLLRNGPAGVFTESIGGVTDVLFNVFRERDGVRVGAQRQVVFPNGNVPRWVH